MAGEFLLGNLRLDPCRLPALRIAFTETFNKIQDQVHRLGADGYIPVPWLGDGTSIETAAYYNDRVTGLEGAPYAALIAYQDVLTQIIGDHYRRTEGENTTRWRWRA